MKQELSRYRHNVHICLCLQQQNQFIQQKNFARHNFNNIKDRISLLNYLIELFYHSTSVNTSNTISPEINDKYDDMFLKCAIEGNAEYLISDDLNSGMHDVEGLGFKILNAKDFCMFFEQDNKF